MLVSNEYKKILEGIHAHEQWGIASGWHFRDVATIIDEYNPKSFLDYGAGAGSLRFNFNKLGMNIDLLEYDPGIPELQNNNLPREMVICIDVLEHVEPELIDNVIEDLHRCAQKLLFASIWHKPAKRILPDGRNAHLIIESPDWWKEKFDRYFDVSGFKYIDDVTMWVLEPKKG